MKLLISKGFGLARDEGHRQFGILHNKEVSGFYTSRSVKSKSNFHPTNMP
jgi:hypothetical protein